MRKLVPILLAGFVAALAVFATSWITAITAHRRSILLFVLAVALAAPASWIARRWHGVGAAAAVWLGIAPLAIAIRGVMGRHVDQVGGMLRSGVWTPPFSRGALEWRIDAPVVRGMWRSPVLVTFVWGMIAFAIAVLVACVVRSRWRAQLTTAIIGAAWFVTIAALVVSAGALAREAGRTEPVAWARALPELPRPTQLSNVRCADPEIDEPVTWHGADMDIELRSSGCFVRFLAHDGTASTAFPANTLEKLTLHHDPQLGVTVAAVPTQISIFRGGEEPAKHPPIRRIPLVHRVTGALAALAAVFALAVRRRSEQSQLATNGPYRSATREDISRGDGTLLRASIALAVAALGAAPLFALFEGGIF